MKTKIKLLSIILLATSFVGCKANPTETPTAEPTLEPTSVPTVEPTVQPTVDPTIIPTVEPTAQPTEEPTVIPSEPEPTVEPSDSTEYTTFVDLEDVYIEVGEKYSLKSTLLTYKGITVTSKDIKIASYGSNSGVILGKKVGQTSLVLEYQGQKQLLNVNVVESGTYSSTFDFNIHRLEGKNIVSFGDSVTADATIGASGLTYPRLFASKYSMNFKANYAIGGTTATYMYKGSNIYKEYANNKTAIDGCRVVWNAFVNDELYDVDVAFIAYGHNDQYFQPPITVEGDDKYCVDDSFVTCHSYKGSYRYMINVLREANPNIRIILLNCTYSEYDKALPSPYGNTYNYQDYRNATKEIASEMNCRYVDPWDYMKDYYDFNGSRQYYSDSVHITAKGHQLLSQYISNN